MRMPAFTKTIRFRLALWYSVTFLVLYILIIGGINLAVGRSVPSGPPPAPDPNMVQRDMARWEDLRDHQRTLVIYSAIGLAAVLVLGSVGSYLLAGRMLKPVDRVSALAGRISHTNLRERIHHQGPDDEVKRLADTFDEMLGRLEEAFESQRRFVQDASHELGTPIAVAHTNIEVLEMQDEKTIKDYEHLTDVLKMSLERMSSVNDSLQLLSQGEQARYHWAPVDVSLIVEEVVSEAASRAMSAGVHLAAQASEAGAWVKGDTMRLKQALMNLVDNAIKYNRPQGSVDVSVYSDETVVTVEVRDTGIGIPQSDLERVFDRFYRVDKSRSRSMGGSGLGLAIVKRIVEDHKGTVTVKSTLGEGSTFKVVLPRTTV